MAFKFGTDLNDTLIGTSGDDVFYSYGGDDTMFGGNGNDTFMAGPGADFMFGEGGNDTVNYSGIAAQPGSLLFNGVYVSLADGFGGEISSSERDHYSSIENVTGSNFNDVIAGDGNANVIRGLDGNDFIQGGAGGDTLEGGNGIDSLLYTDSTARIVVDLLNNTASSGYATGDVISGFENVAGSNFNDNLSGTNGANTIEGGAGNDTINGRGGNDIINGGDGNDIMTGGTGSDTFLFREDTNSGLDHIMDFDVHQDHIQFDIDGAGGLSYGYVFNASTLTMDVTIDFANAGAVVIEDLSLADYQLLSSRVDMV
jgi:Ca2+-binding RTX toxin-like protein